MVALVMAVLLAGTPPRVTPPREAAYTSVRRFYSTYRTMPNYGIPDPPDLARLAPLMSRRLKGLIDAALKYRASLTCGDCKPPWSDGNFFASNVEGYTSFSLGPTTLDKAVYLVPVRFEYIDAADPKHPGRWTDTARVVQEDGRYVIDDIAFGAEWPYANHGLLSESLTERW